MDKKDIESRLKELGIYSDYYYKLELKVLAKVLNFDEVLNSVITGVLDGRRRMIAVTDFRLIVVAAGAISAADVLVIRRDAIKSWKFNRKFLLSSVEIETEGKSFLFKQTQAGQQKLFTWAMNQPIRKFDE